MKVQRTKVERVRISILYDDSSSEEWEGKGLPLPPQILRFRKRDQRALRSVL